MLRDALHTEEGIVAQHGGVGTVSAIADLFKSAHQFDSGTGSSDTSDCQRAKRNEDQGRVAVLNPASAREVEPPL